MRTGSSAFTTISLCAALALSGTQTVFGADAKTTAPIYGTYEYVIGTTRSHAQEALSYWKTFGFEVRKEGHLSSEESRLRYGVDLPVHSYRLQNGTLEDHGKLRIMVWETDKPLPDLGVASIMTPGVRWTTQLVDNILGLSLAYRDIRNYSDSRYVISDLVRNYLGATGPGKSISDRYKGVYEIMVRNPRWNQVFFQREGYKAEGYGVVNMAAPIPSSEFTHGGIVVRNMDKLDFYTKTLGLVDRGKTLQGAVRQKNQISGPFMFDYGQGYIAHNIQTPASFVGQFYYLAPMFDPVLAEGSAGKVVMDLVLPSQGGPLPILPDSLSISRPGIEGISHMSFKVLDIQDYHRRVSASEATDITPVLKDEFGEMAFSFVAPDGVYWTLIQHY